MMKTETWANRYFYNKLAVDADQAEWQAVIYGSAHIMAGTMDDEMSEAADEDVIPMQREERLEAKNIALEQVQGRAAEIIHDRLLKLQKLYPFRIEENTLVYLGGQDRVPIYEFLLGVSRADSLTAGEFVKLPRVFEDVSKIAAISFLGEHGQGLRAGWPREENRAWFKAMIDGVRSNSGNHGSEWQWMPGEDLPANPTPRSIKDAGLDVVAWRKWPDGRGASLYLLGQCACGSDWLGKDEDLSLKTLWRWCKPTMVDPLRGFFTPHHATKSILHDLSPTAGLVFDRIRIVECLSATHVNAQVSEIAPLLSEAISIAQTPYVKLEKAVAKKKPIAAKKVTTRRSAKQKQQL